MLLLALALLADFPTTQGNEWSFDLEAAGSKGTATIRVLSAWPTTDGINLTLATTASIASEKVYGTENWSIGPRGIYKLSGPQGQFEPPLPVVIPGESNIQWKGELVYEGLRTKAEASIRTAESDRVESPAGRFDAVRSRVALTLYDGAKSAELATTYWFAEKIGWAKVESDLPGGIVTLVLRKFNPSKN